MNTRYRLIFRGVRGELYYCVDKRTGKRISLQTTNEDEARQIIEVKNAAKLQTILNLQIAKAYIAGTDSGVGAAAKTSWAKAKAAGKITLKTFHTPALERRTGGSAAKPTPKNREPSFKQSLKAAAEAGLIRMLIAPAGSHSFALNDQPANLRNHFRNLG